MRFKAKDWDFVCTKTKKGGVYDLFIYNPDEEVLFLEENIGCEYLKGTDSFGNPYCAVEISPKSFYTIFKKLFKDKGCGMGFFENYEEDSCYIKRDAKIQKELVFKAVKGGLTEKELSKIVQEKFEKADYYDFDAFVSVIHKFLNNAISKRYYLDWLIVVCGALNENMFKKGSKKQKIYQKLSDCFDGHSFDTLEEEKERECQEFLAMLKYYNHLLSNTNKIVEPPFYNKNNTVVYVCFSYCNGYNEHYKICIAVEDNEVFKIALISNPFYMEEVNYTFIEDDDFEDLTNKYYDFYHDKSIDIHKYIIENPYLDKDGKVIDKQ